VLQSYTALQHTVTAEDPLHDDLRDALAQIN